MTLKMINSEITQLRNTEREVSQEVIIADFTTYSKLNTGSIGYVFNHGKPRKYIKLSNETIDYIFKHPELGMLYDTFTSTLVDTNNTLKFISEYAIYEFKFLIQSHNLDISGNHIFNDLNKYNVYNLGDHIFNDLNDTINRFQDFSKKLFVDFDWTNIICAGGCMNNSNTRKLAKVCANSDIDLWIMSEYSDRIAKINYVAEYFSKFDAKFIVTSYLMNIFVKGIIIQLIFNKQEKNIIELIDNFDLPYIRIAFDGKHLYFGKDYFRSNATRVIDCVDNTSCGRIYKSVLKGFIFNPDIKMVKKVNGVKIKMNDIEVMARKNDKLYFASSDEKLEYYQNESVVKLTQVTSEYMTKIVMDFDMKTKETTQITKTEFAKIMSLYDSNSCMIDFKQFKTHFGKTNKIIYIITPNISIDIIPFYPVYDQNYLQMIFDFIDDRLATPNCVKLGNIKAPVKRIHIYLNPHVFEIIYVTDNYEYSKT